MNFKSLLSASLLCLCLLSLAQESGKLSGLWVIQKVIVGGDEMTPDARWTRLNADGTQESGNGWFQHSYGTWSVDESTGLLSIVSVNGLEDRFGGFKVELTSEEAVWTRNEEGAEVKVFLSRASSLPATLRDRMMGLWKLTDMQGKGPLIEKKKVVAYLFIRWDGKFVFNVGEEKIYGVYNVHAHKPEIELIPYGKKQRTWWRVDLANELTIQLLNSDEQVVKRSFKRVNSYE